jgi:GAF domain-containing protein/HAMP domain-containing protein
MGSNATLATRPTRSSFAAFNNLPLSIKLIFFFVVVVVVTEFTLVYFSSSTISQELLKNKGDSLRASGETTADEIATVIQENTVSPMIALSLNKLVQDRVAQVNAGYQGTPDAIPAQLQALDKEWVNDPDTADLIQSRITGDLATELTEFRAHFPANAEIFVTDQYGGVVVASNRTTDYYQADEEWWQKAWNGGQGAIYVGQPQYDQSAQTYSVPIALPVYAHSPGGEEKGIGVIRSTLAFNVIQKVISDFKLGETGQLDLFLPGDLFISRAGGQSQSASAETLAQLRTISNADFGQIPSYQGNDSIVSVVSVGAVADESYLANLGWSVVIHQATSEALQPVTDAVRTDLTVGIGVAIIAGLVGVLIARLISRPVVRLTQTTQRFAEGDFGQRALVSSRDEVGRLASSFNAMADQIQDFVGTLEGRVVASTHDLQTVVDVNAQISTVLDEGRLLQDVVDLTKERFRLYHAHIYLVDGSGATLALTAGAGHVGRQMVSEKRTISTNNQQSIVASAARSRNGIIINDVNQSRTFLPNPLLPDTRSELAVPLVARGQLLGVLDVQSDRVDFFTDDMLSVIELMAGQIANAISNARLYENAERTSRHERALGNIDRKIQDAVDMDEILQITVRELGKALRVPYTAIELRLNQSNEQNNNQEIVS